MEYYLLIEDSLIYIEKNLHKPLSLESVSSRFFVSKFYFHRLFSAIMGCSLNSYILSRRLNKSLKLIRESKFSLTDIAYSLNFGSPASFSRSFKNHYGFAPKELKNYMHFSFKPLPTVVKRPIKNINGDIVTDFTLEEFKGSKLSGIAFEVDLAKDDYKEKISYHLDLVLNENRTIKNIPFYTIYSNCQPNSTKFKVLVGISKEIQSNLPNYFIIDIPTLFCAKFKYFGDLLEIGDVFASDFARFLRISKLKSKESHIELIQKFDDINNISDFFHIYVPIKKLAIDSS
jgi:AraC family transcriptional regulator